MTDREPLPVTAAVWLGALVLVGFPTIAAVAATLEGLAVAVLGEDAGLATLLVAGAVALAAGLTATEEAARVRLHGWAELRRGPPGRRLLRHAALAVPGLALLWVLVQVLVELATFVAGSAGEEVPVGLYLLLVASIAVIAWVLVRTARGFLEGWRDAA